MSNEWGDDLTVDGLEELQQYDEEIAVLHEQRENISDRITGKRRQKRETMTEVLYTLQEELRPEQEIPLIRMREDYGRGGSWTYNEVLTNEGVVAKDVTYHYGSRETESSKDILSHWSAEDEPLDIESQYLTDFRTRPKYIDKLADRIEALPAGDEELPRGSLQYKGNPNNRG